MSSVAANALRGSRVLIPRGGPWGQRVAADLDRRGAEGVIAPLIASVPPRDVAARDRAFAALAAGEYAWLFVTSAAAVEQLVAAGVRIPAGTHVAAVGRATARAVADAGAEVSFVPVGTSSAAALVAQWRTGRSPATTGRCLVLRSDLATALISDELEMRGFAVDVCIGYRTVGVDLAPAVRGDLAAGRIDVVLLTSLSVGRELRRQVPELPAATLVASIGPGTTADAVALGYRVGYTAQTQAIDALVAELDARARTAPASAPAAASAPDQEDPR
ncbi:uroporphyrinogen-III synthase [Microbacterium telephonicum]|uniref:Uroporphyrinogen-III synthase n=1 Tax=Microbacterium telephonicum TaxID=1714841 RepID=A0A498C9E0_9MICO|nr:uroporphyrinogen-III synthase [Microbacterium telephonicum]RLK48951.1 uroporphyrinogen-III synthase [Microbacterium telephonicum]